MRADNPFAPGAATPPPLIAGRDEYLDEFDDLISRTRAGAPSPTRLYVGLRGIGKTTLLNAFVDRARHRGWAATRLQADPGGAGIGRQLIGEIGELGAVFDRRVGRGALRRFAERVEQVRAHVNLGVVGGSVQLERPPDGAPVGDVPDVRQALDGLSELATAARSGVLLTFDELHDADVAELRLVGTVVQIVASERAPVLIAGAGLPSLRDRAPDVGATSFLERAVWTTLDRLDVADTASAVTGPLADHGVAIDDDALETIVTETRGYPYLIQLVAAHTWDAAAGRRQIVMADVERGRRLAARALDDGMFRLRWNKLSPAARRYVAALAQLVIDTGRVEIPSGDVAAALETTAQSLSRHRERAIASGVVEAAPFQRMRFTLPWFEEYAVHQYRREQPRV